MTAILAKNSPNYRFVKTRLVLIAALVGVLVSPVAMALPQGLRIMSYNIQQMGYPAFVTHHFEKPRLEALPDAVRNMESLPDVIVFQEAFLPASRDFLLDSLGDLFPYATRIGGESCGQEGWDGLPENCEQGVFRHITHNSGVFILSRWPIEKRHSLTYENVRVSYTFDFMARKGSVYALINKLGDYYHVVGTHLQADEASHDVRMSQLSEMQAWLSGLDLEKHFPLYIAGDFNVSSVKENELNDLLQKLQVKNSFCGSDLNSVSPETNQYLRFIYGNGESKTLDYIFQSEVFAKVKNVSCLRALDFKSEKPWKDVFFWETYEFRDISDHYPVVLEFVNEE